MTTPFSIPEAHIELSSSYVAAINRVLYDIAHEVDRTLNASPSRQHASSPELAPSARGLANVAALPVRIVFERKNAPRFSEGGDAITVTPVPFLFNRSINAWSLAAVLDWPKWAKRNGAGSFGFDFTPEALLPGILYRHLANRTDQHKALTHIVGWGNSLTRKPPEFFFCESYIGESPGDSQVSREEQTPPPEWVQSEEVQKKHEGELNDIYLKVVDDIDPRCQRFIVLTPIHDIRPYGRSFGPPIGCLLLNVGLTRYAHENDEHFVTNEMQDEFIVACRAVGKRVVPRLNRSAELLSAEIHKTAMVQVNQDTALASATLLRHYCATLRHVQFWERIHVYQRGAYCFSFVWQDQAGSSRSQWVEQRVAEEARLRHDRTYFAPFGMPASVCSATKVLCEELDPVKDLGLEFEPSDLPSIIAAQLVFEFPAAAVLPRAEEPYLVKAFSRELQYQQLEVFRAMLPLRRARRNALRTAVSAIMGRNMSHNIGSHVLARYSSKAGDDRATVVRDRQDHRGDLLSYLQRRMDFIAEVATADRPFGSQVLSLRNVIERLNYGKQVARFEEIFLRNEPDGGPCKADPDCLHFVRPLRKSPLQPRQPILLSFITGKESMLASVEYGEPIELCEAATEARRLSCSQGFKAAGSAIDHSFASPGGEVGAHSLYVIIENILRNSARHGRQESRPVRLFVHAIDENHADFLSVEIIDPRTRFLDGRGCVDEGRQKKWLEQQQKINRSQSRSLFDKGKRSELHSLPAEINSILADEPLLDRSGQPNHKYWGVREMQICAHLLRGGSLSGVETEAARFAALEALAHPLPDGTWCLKYRLQVQRAKLVAVVVEDPSPWVSEELRRRGFVVLQGPARGEPNAAAQWNRVAQVASPYAFLLVQDGIALPEGPQRSTLPIRAAHAELKYIARVLDPGTDVDETMEELHLRMVERYQGRPAWESRKAMYGLVLSRHDCIHPGAREGEGSPSSGGGLFIRVADDNPGSHRPLPAGLDAWLDRLRADSMAAVWVDHCQAEDFSALRGLELANLGQPPSISPLWVSTEGAFSDSAHTAFINELGQARAGNELLAAALARVVVLDERVQAEADRPGPRAGLPLRELWPLAGIWVPSREEGPGDLTNCCLDVPDFTAIRAYLLRPTVREDQLPVDFLVVHLTILEGLRDETRPSVSRVLQDLVEGTPAESAEVVVVTGRGVPAVARKLGGEDLERARFLPVSVVYEPLVLRPSKLGLMRVLWSAGRPTPA